MNIRNLICLVLAALLLLCPGALALAAAAAPEVTATAVLLADRETGRVLYERNAEERVYPASVTKIMTVLLAVEAIERGECAEEELVTPTEAVRYDLRADGSTQNIEPGETMRLIDLLYCAMLSSANEACNIIAEHIAGDIPAFLVLMNERAERLGCTGTRYSNTHGLPDETHYTTARDQFRIAQEALRHPLFAAICGTVTETVPATNLSDARALKNTNALVNANVHEGRYYYEGASGVKTGYTGAAGHCLVSTAARGGVELIAVVMGSGLSRLDDGAIEYGSFAGSVSLYDWGFSAWSYREIADAETPAAQLDVEDGKADTVELYPAQNLTALLPKDLDLDDVTVKLNLFGGEEGLTAPVAEGETLGEMTLIWKGETLGTVPLLAGADVEPLGTLDRLDRGIDQILSKLSLDTLLSVLLRVFGAGLLCYVALVLASRALGRGRRRRRARRDPYRPASGARRDGLTSSGRRRG